MALLPSFWGCFSVASLCALNNKHCLTAAVGRYRHSLHRSCAQSLRRLQRGYCQATFLSGAVLFQASVVVRQNSGCQNCACGLSALCSCCLSDGACSLL